MKVSEKIRELNNRGFEVDIIHTRNTSAGYLTVEQARKYGVPVDPRGGRTIANVYTKIYTKLDHRNSTSIAARGVADCSHSDNYNRTIGAQIALGRAIKELYSPVF